MRVFLNPEDWMSRGIRRVAMALQRYKPAGVTIVEDESQADLSIVHMVGDGQRKHWLEPKRPYAIVQYCLRTTELPNTKDWEAVWRGAKSVWSYYDLPSKMREDGYANIDIYSLPFYIRPLGVDFNVFRPSLPVRKPYMIGTSGFIAETEGVKECYAAMQKVARRGQFHLGPFLDLGPNVTYLLNVPDNVVAKQWSQCAYVAGLRRIEGFELPVLEGLACGARPICFDAPHYRQWFGDHVEYVREGTHEEVVEDLVRIFSGECRPILPDEHAYLRATFDWEPLCMEFWKAVLQ